MLGFNDTSTLVGHFVSSPREGEKRDRRANKEREIGKEDGNERKMKVPPLPLPAARTAGLAQL